MIPNRTPDFTLEESESCPEARFWIAEGAMYLVGQNRLITIRDLGGRLWAPGWGVYLIQADQDAYRDWLVKNDTAT